MTQSDYRSLLLLQTFDPLSKLGVVMCLTLLVMSWDNPLPQTILLLVLLGLARYGAGMKWGVLRRRMSMIVGFGIPLFCVTVLAAPSEGGSTLVTFGPLIIDESGVIAGTVVTQRMFILFLSSIIYIYSTDPRDLVAALTIKLKVPYRLAFGISIALAFIPLLEEEGRIAAVARKLRGARKPKGPRESMLLWRDQLIAVFTGALRRVQQTAGAMEAKGFGAYRDRTFVRTITFTRRGWLLVGCSVLVMVLLWGI